MKVRWFMKRFVGTFRGREEEWHDHPVLQYFDDGNWYDVPTIKQTKDGEEQI